MASKDVPTVSTVSVPDEGAVHRYQTVWPPSLSLKNPGPPLLALTFVPCTVPDVPLRVCGSECTSLDGNGPEQQPRIHVRVAGVGSALPAASIARTRIVCVVSVKCS